MNVSNSRKFFVENKKFLDRYFIHFIEKKVNAFIDRTRTVVFNKNKILSIQYVISLHSRNSKETFNPSCVASEIVLIYLKTFYHFLL